MNSAVTGFCNLAIEKMVGGGRSRVLVIGERPGSGASPRV